MLKNIKLNVVAIFLIFLFVQLVPAQNYPELVLGNPSNATKSVSNSDNFLILRSGFFLSYNKSRGGANWVNWHLSKSDFGDAERQDLFPEDTFLPEQWRINKISYVGSGFAKGHLCPSEDRTNTQAANDETFVMTNMQPQTTKLNGGTWKSLENDIRNIVNLGYEAYIYAGCYGDQGRIDNKVTIPTQCFKIVLFLLEGSNDLDRIKRYTRVISVDMPNTTTIESGWWNYRTTVDEIEQKTGFDFFSKVPNNIENVLEKYQ